VVRTGDISACACLFCNTADSTCPPATSPLPACWRRNNAAGLSPPCSAAYMTAGVLATGISCLIPVAAFVCAGLFSGDEYL